MTSKKNSPASKVLMLIENISFPWDRRMRHLAMALQQSGYEVRVICPMGESQDHDSFEIFNGIKVYRYPMLYQASGGLGYIFEYSWAFLCTTILSLWVLIRDGFDIIHSANPPDMFFLLAWPYKLFGKKYVYDQHDVCPELYESKFEKRDWFYRMLVFFEKMSYHTADLAIATNESYRNIARERGGLPERRVAIVRNGVDTSYFRRAKPRPELKEPFRYMALYLGVMGKQDGVDRVVRAAHQVVHAYGRRDVLFLMIGKGESWLDLQELSRTLKVDDVVRFVGRISDELLLDYLSIADIALAPDPPCRMNDLSTMTKILEYMACELPIVSSDLTESHFSAGDAAVYVEKDDANLFARAILELLDDPDRCERMGQIGLDRSTRLMGWNRSRASLLEAYSRISGLTVPTLDPPKETNRTIRVPSITRTAKREIDSLEIPRFADYLAQYYRYPADSVKIIQTGIPSGNKDFFRFGPDVLCYGHCEGLVSDRVTNASFDAMRCSHFEGDEIFLPFDLTEIVDNLRNELYANSVNSNSALAGMYYFLRPLLSIDVRKRLQKFRLNGWRDLKFPRWPVDSTVDTLFEQLLSKSLQSDGNREIPFIWFWPDGASSCAIMTHDVETPSGKDFCPSLMDINDSFGIRASFQIVPERRYEVSAEFISSIRDRGYEVNIQDLNHDGRLFAKRQQFVERAEKINSYGKQYGAEGFRAAVLYRNQEWYDALDFAYDMSVPNVAHLDPQRGGCCTVMPYFIGDVLELPVTTTQDYSLFHIINDYSIGLWKQQIDLIMAKNGLISFIVHPDYVIPNQARKTYEELIGYLANLRDKKHVWMPLPGEVNRWWRQRAQMKLVQEKDNWRIEGEGSERASIAYARQNNGVLQVNYQRATASPWVSSSVR
jgi:glycosyltransferase involved in cell wall biosynthesis